MKRIQWMPVTMIPTIVFFLAILPACVSNLSERHGWNLIGESLPVIAERETYKAMIRYEVLEKIKSSNIYDPNLRTLIDDGLSSPTTPAMLDGVRNAKREIEDWKARNK